jgi:hypothetical protein
VRKNIQPRIYTDKTGSEEFSQIPVIRVYPRLICFELSCPTFVKLLRHREIVEVTHAISLGPDADFAGNGFSQSVVEQVLAI